ncbi:folate-binding protein [Aquabacterium sp.]|uniref:CAF17-like 4Fe-4S cluster assembly/insertion protein YgfZ n=1 Tax=Aquabacterium sp. TaxID=1872578 RepID=UPI0025B8EB9B|nr:folate-binding protein [Aquabacterium sp.]
MSSIQLPDPTSWGGALLLSDLGIISADGADAANFLHGQFSQDINGQTAQEARLAAYCSAKGRMLASLLNLRPASEQILMLTDSQVLPGLLKRLSMFVMRSKVKLSDAGASMAVVGLLGEPAAAHLGDAAAGAPWGVQPVLNGWLVGLPAVLGARRWYWVGPKADAQALVDALPALDAGAWQWLDVMSGLPRIEAATVDQFVPQMINFELIGGVNFKKGCYPGQEVVARSQYRGTTKRRAFVVHAAAALQPGQEVFSSADPAQPAGLVVNTASANGVHSALVELKLNALGSDLRAGSAEGVALTMGALPYEVPQAEEAA